MAIDLKDQTFGVEIEFTGITRERAAQVVAEHFDTYSSDPDYSCYYTRKISDDTGREWKVMRDASIDPVRKNRSETYNMDEYRCELVTPILKSDKDMDDLQQIVRDLRKAGMRVNESCGLHVHIGAERQDAKSLTRLSNIMYQKEDILYRALNLHAYFTKGTVEFRCFNSTTNAGKVRTYVRFAQAVTAQALNQRSAAVHKTQSSNECYTFRTWLIRIGLNGDEFKVPRKYLLENLEGAKDWKDKAAAMERRRIREQQAQQIAQRLNDMRAASPEPETITISSIIPFSRS